MTVAIKHFSVDARAMLTWGRESLKDHTTAILELVKNSYDANASVVLVQIRDAPENRRDKVIRIVDDGHGMSETDFDNSWLRLGFSAKQRVTRTSTRRRKVGEKGIGRVSADRLGSELEIRSVARNSMPFGLRVRWDAFDSPGKALDAIPVHVLRQLAFKVPSFSQDPLGTPMPTLAQQASGSRPGTELVIRGLRQSWRHEDVRGLHHELSILCSPFDETRDFHIWLDSDIAPELSGIVASPFIQRAVVQGRFSFTKAGTIEYRLADRNSSGHAKLKREKWATWSHRTHEAVEQGSPPTLGPLDAVLYFYPQKGSTLEGTSLTKADLQRFLNLNSGIKLYRDGVRVAPYGDNTKPEGDWLRLGERKARNPAGAGRADFRVAPNQIVGAVFLSRDNNPTLVDTSGREGLVQSDEYSQLKAFLIGCLIRLETHYHRLFREDEKQRAAIPTPPARETIRTLDRELRELSKNLDSVRESLPSGVSREVDRIRDQIDDTFDHLEKASRSVEELATQAIVFRGLATLGITAATFGHETEMSLDAFLSSAQTANDLLHQPNVDPSVAISELDKAIAQGRKVSAWGAFALRRVRQDKRKRRTVAIHTLVSDILDEMMPAIGASSIEVSHSLASVQGKVFAMDVEAVVINLVANAYHFSRFRNGREITSAFGNPSRAASRAGSRLK